MLVSGIFFKFSGCFKRESWWRNVERKNVWSANHFSYVNPRVDNSKQEARETYQFTCTRAHALDIHAFLGDPATMPRPNPYRVSQRTLSFFFHVGTHYQNGLISFSALSPPSYWNFFPSSSILLPRTIFEELDRSILPIDNKEKENPSTIVFFPIKRSRICSTMKGSTLDRYKFQRVNAWKEID